LDPKYLGYHNEKVLGFWKKWVFGEDEDKVIDGFLSFFLSFFLSLFL